MPNHLPSDPYRPCAALDSFVRARDGYCTVPGCGKPAWSCDIDHIWEFDQARTAEGGRTCRANMGVKCTFHHLLKTFGNWLDDQWVDNDGRTHVEIRTPEGYAVHGWGHTTEELFPALRGVRFEDLGPSGGSQASSGGKPTGGAPPGPAGKSREGPQRRRPRTEEKHARRRYERQKNRQLRMLREAREERDLAALGVPAAPPF